jgi:hypothetical protein
MKFTKKLTAMVLCGIMAASSVVSVTASADSVTTDISSEIINTVSEVAPVGLISELHTVFNIPRYKQTGNECWLECVRSAANYKLGTNYSDSDIRSIMAVSPAITTGSDGGISPSKTVRLLNRIFAKNKSKLRATLVERTLSYDEVKGYISNDNPIIMYALNNSAGTAHDVVISGYATCWQDYGTYHKGDYTGLVLMNPQEGSEEYFYDSNTSDSSFSFTNSKNYTYTWNQTIVIS